jgi:hypothetical protein
MEERASELRQQHPMASLNPCLPPTHCCCPVWISIFLLLSSAAHVHFCSWWVRVLGRWRIILQSHGSSCFRNELGGFSLTFNLSFAIALNYYFQSVCNWHQNYNFKCLLQWNLWTLNRNSRSVLCNLHWTIHLQALFQICWTTISSLVCNCNELQFLISFAIALNNQFQAYFWRFIFVFQSLYLNHDLFAPQLLLLQSIFPQVVRGTKSKE